MIGFPAIATKIGISLADKRQFSHFGHRWTRYKPLFIVILESGQRNARTIFENFQKVDMPRLCSPWRWDSFVFSACSLAINQDWNGARFAVFRPLKKFPFDRLLKKYISRHLLAFPLPKIWGSLKIRQSCFMIFCLRSSRGEARLIFDTNLCGSQSREDQAIWFHSNMDPMSE
jgi:hypothetical protein